jgi:hypothetical protein
VSVTDLKLVLQDTAIAAENDPSVSVQPELIPLSDITVTAEDGCPGGVLPPRDPPKLTLRLLSPERLALSPQGSGVLSIEQSTDLKSWQEIAVVDAGVDFELDIVSGSRFFRVISSP